MKTKLFLIAILFYTTNSFSQKTAPDFEGKDIKGNEVKLSELQDQLVYLDFWASWCRPCKESFPFMSELHEKYSESGLTIIAVNVDSEPVRMNSFLNSLESKTEFTVLYDKDTEIVEKYKVEGLPSSFFIHNGKIISTHIGFKSSDKNKIESEIQKLLKEINR